MFLFLFILLFCAENFVSSISAACGAPLIVGMGVKVGVAADNQFVSLGNGLRGIHKLCDTIRPEAAKSTPFGTIVADICTLFHQLGEGVMSNWHLWIGNRCIFN